MERDVATFLHATGLAAAEFRKKRRYRGPGKPVWTVKDQAVLDREPDVRFLAFAEQQGLTVSCTSRPPRGVHRSAAGCYDSAKKLLWVRESLSRIERPAVIVHELAHFLHAPHPQVFQSGEQRDLYALGEVIAEGVSWIVCKDFLKQENLMSPIYTAHYLAGATRPMKILQDAAPRMVKIATTLRGVLREEPE